MRLGALKVGKLGVTAGVRPHTVLNHTCFNPHKFGIDLSNWGLKELMLLSGVKTNQLKSDF